MLIVWSGSTTHGMLHVESLIFNRNAFEKIEILP